MTLLATILFCAPQSRLEAAREFARIVNARSRGTYESPYAVMASTHTTRNRVRLTKTGFSFRMEDTSMPTTVVVKGYCDWANLGSTSLRTECGANWTVVEIKFVQEVDVKGTAIEQIRTPFQVKRKIYRLWVSQESRCGKGASLA